MKIAVFLSGTINNGLDSPTSGEGRWGMELARMLAYYGHDIVCYTDPGSASSWGVQRPLSNVRIERFHKTQEKFDVALYIPWEHQYNGQEWETCETLPLSAKWFVHCTFSWTLSLPDHNCYNNNHVLAYPYIQENQQFPPSESEGNPYKVFPLPIPLYQNFSPVDLGARKDILWSTKDVFHPGWGSVDHQVPAIGMRVLKAIKRLSDAHDLKAHFLSTGHFNPANSFLSRDLDVMGLVESLPNYELYELLPRDTLMEIMAKSRITAIVSGLLGSFGDSIVSGSVPLCYEGHIYRNAAKKHDLILNTVTATEDEIFDCFNRLYTDDAFFLEVLADYRDELRFYSYEATYGYFKNMVKELMGVEL